MDLLPKVPIYTPFGRVALPLWETPPSVLPRRPDERERQALLHGLGEDLAMVVGFIPTVGDFIEDVLEDLHGREIEKLLTPEEHARFMEYNKVGPTTLALVRTLLLPRRP